MQPLPERVSELSPARRRTAHVMHAIALPMAAFCVLAPSWSLWSDYQHVANLVSTHAQVLEARVVNASRLQSEWDVYVRYPVRDRIVETSMTIWSTRGVASGDTITVLVDPDTGRAEDDVRPTGWWMVGFGGIAAVFFWFAGFRGLGAMLRHDRALRRGRPA